VVAVVAAITVVVAVELTPIRLALTVAVAVLVLVTLTQQSCSRLPITQVLKQEMALHLLPIPSALALHLSQHQ
jgi:uncharacterized membrane protein YwaF